MAKIFQRSAVAAAALAAGGPAIAENPWEAETALTDETRAAFARQLLDEGGAAGFETSGTKGTDGKTGPFYDAVPDTQWIPRFGPEVETVRLIEIDEAGAAKPVVKYWLQLSRDQFLQQLNNQYSETLLFKKNKGGGFSFTGAATAGANAKKGEYRLVHNNFRYKIYPCSEKEPKAGELAVGVGLRITVDAVFKSGGFNLGFGPLALSASRDELQGVIRAEVKGLANSVTLSTIASEIASDSVTFDSLIKASNLNAVAGQALESISGPTTPTVMGYRDGGLPGSCLAAMRGELEG